MTLSDDEDEQYNAYCPMVMSLQVVWPNENSKSGQVRGDVSWHYGVLWASSEALSHRKQMFWPSGSQTEQITGTATRRMNSKGQTQVQYQLRTAHNGFGVLDTKNTNDVAYTFRRFEVPRSFTLETDYEVLTNAPAPVVHVVVGNSAAASLPGLFGSIRVNNVQSFGERDGENSEEEPFPESRVRLLAISKVQANHSVPEAILQHRRVKKIDFIMHQLRALEKVGPEGTIHEQKLLNIIARIIQEPINTKVRSINPEKLEAKWPTLIEALKQIGFRSSMEVMNNGSRQRRLILSDTADLLELCELYTTISDEI